MEARFYAPVHTGLGHTQPPVQWVQGLPGGKATGAWRWPPTPSSAKFNDRIELYIYCTCGPSWAFCREIYILQLTLTAYHLNLREHRSSGLLPRLRVITYLLFGTAYRSPLGPWRWDPIGCPGMSARNYHRSLHNNTEERSSHLLHLRF
jgi:hypothetical protein